MNAPFNKDLKENRVLSVAFVVEDECHQSTGHRELFQLERCAPRTLR
jgi:hypothetical protein